MTLFFNGDMVVSSIIKVARHPLHSIMIVWGYFQKTLSCYGINVARLKQAFMVTPLFLRNLIKYNYEYKKCDHKKIKNFKVKYRDITPCLSDYCDNAGKIGGSYFYQDIWAARKIYEKKPEKHIDVGSRIDGFVSHLLIFRDVTLVDVRDINAGIDGLNFIKSDATNMSGFDANSIESLSSLHAAEHFGLGRYTDPIDPVACFDFMENLQRVLRENGRLYFSVPIGAERLVFNANRIFSPITIIETFNELKLLSFSAVTKDRSFVENVDYRNYLKDRYVCGLFEFTK